MKIKLLGVVAVSLLTACSSNFEDPNHYVIEAGSDDTSYLENIDACPKVHIRKHDVRIVQKSGHTDLFEIKAVGYQGRCYFDSKLGKHRAEVMPRFKITRLSENSEVSDVQFSYYLETAEGPAHYLGRKTFFANVNMPQGLMEQYYNVPGGELTIPDPGTYNLDMYLGLNADVYDQEYKQ